MHSRVTWSRELFLTTKGRMSASRQGPTIIHKYTALSTRSTMTKSNNSLPTKHTSKICRYLAMQDTTIRSTSKMLWRLHGKAASAYSPQSYGGGTGSKCCKATDICYDLDLDLIGCHPGWGMIEYLRIVKTQLLSWYKFISLLFFFSNSPYN